MQLERNVKIGLVIILVAVSPVIFTGSAYLFENMNPLKTALILSPGEFQSPEFITNLPGTYDVRLAFDAMRDTNREHCLIGEDSSEDVCKGINQTLNFDWTVIGDVVSIENGGHFKIEGMTDSKNEVGPTLGTFEAKRGGHQKIVLNISSDAGELNTAHPRLMVEAERVYGDDWVVWMSWLLVFASFASLAIGFVWTMTILWRKLVASSVELPSAGARFSLILTITVMIACAYTTMRWYSLYEQATMFGLRLQELLGESRPWGVAALALMGAALMLSLSPVWRQPRRWFVRAAFCILGTFGVAVLFYFLSEILK